MANIGNLFLNISGSTKGLTKALASAKGQINQFDRSVGRAPGETMRRSKSNWMNAVNERRRIQNMIGPQPLGTMGRLQRKEGRARKSYRGMQRSQVASMQGIAAKASVGAVLAVIGITISVLRNAFNTARQQAKEAENKIDKYKMMGPFAGQIIQSQVRTRLAAMAKAQDPAVSRMFLQKQLRAEDAFATSSGEKVLGSSMAYDQLVSASGSAMSGAFSEYSAAGSALGLGPYQLLYGAIKGLFPSTTGPVSTTGNTGGP